MSLPANQKCVYLLASVPANQSEVCTCQPISSVCTCQPLFQPTNQKCLPTSKSSVCVPASLCSVSQSSGCVPANCVCQPACVSSSQPSVCVCVSANNQSTVLNFNEHSIELLYWVYNFGFKLLLELNYNWI